MTHETITSMIIAAAASDGQIQIWIRRMNTFNIE